MINKKTIIISIVSSFITGTVVSMCMLKVPGMLSEILPEWLSAVGTIGAVIIALYLRNNKPKIGLDATQHYSHYYEAETYGDESAVYQRVENAVKDAYWDLTILVTNYGETSAGIVEIGVIGDGCKYAINENPFVVRGLDACKLQFSEYYNKLSKYEIRKAHEKLKNSTDAYIYVLMSNGTEIKTPLKTKRDEFDEIGTEVPYD